MGHFHWLLLIGYYFFAALTCLLVLMLLGRVLRASVTINTLVMGAIGVSLIAIVLPLLLGWARLADYTGARLLLLGLSTFVLAALDVALQRWLPLPLDRELEEL